MPGSTLMVVLAVQVLPNASTMVNVTGNGPVALYICVLDEVYAVNPSPKFHVHETIVNDGEPAILNVVGAPVQTGDGLTLMASGT